MRNQVLRWCQWKETRSPEKCEVVYGKMVEVPESQRLGKLGQLGPAHKVACGLFYIFPLTMALTGQTSLFYRPVSALV